MTTKKRKRHAPIGLTILWVLWLLASGMLLFGAGVMRHTGMIAGGLVMIFLGAVAACNTCYVQALKDAGADEEDTTRPLKPRPKE